MRSKATKIMGAVSFIGILVLLFFDPAYDLRLILGLAWAITMTFVTCDQFLDEGKSLYWSAPFLWLILPLVYLFGMLVFGLQKIEDLQLVGMTLLLGLSLSGMWAIENPHDR